MSAATDLAVIQTVRCGCVNSKKLLWILLVCGLLGGALIFGLKPVQPGAAAINQSRVQVEGFGAVELYSLAKPDKGHLILFDSTAASVANRQLAQRWAQKGYVTSVVHFSPHASASGCVDLTVPLDRLGQVVKQQFTAVKDLAPMVMGRGDDAMLAYIALAQAPVKTFHAGLAVDFCPSKSAVPVFCAQRAWSGEQSFPPQQALGANFYVFQTGAFRQGSCGAASQTLLASSSAVKLSQSQNTQDDWFEVDALLNWLDPRLTSQAQSSQNSNDAPVVEVAAHTEKTADYFVLLLTGDGGWAKLDKDLAEHFSAAGAEVLGFDCLNYFWRKRSVEETAAQISALITQYQNRWQKKHVVLVGYSFGADVLPYVVNALPVEQQREIKHMVLLGLSRYAHFEFYLTNWLSGSTRTSPFPTQDELAKIKLIPGLCVQGAEDKESICAHIQQPNVQAVTLPGDHHYAEDYQRLADSILGVLNQPRP